MRSTEMNTLPPMPPDRVHIAGDALDRIPSNNGGGAYAHQRRKSVTELKQHAISEKEIDEDGDDRDIRKKQVIMARPFRLSTL